jgi:D-alanyl-D-alanine carboxypeptidase
MGALTLTTVHLLMVILLGAPLDVQIDRAHGLPPWYAPGEHPAARAALERMIQDLGLPVQVVSGYRSYDEQRRAYGRLVAEHGRRRADQVIARPGFSEHQLGTAFDLAWAGLPMEWNVPRNRLLWAALEAHAHEYGFVVSYPLKRIESWPYDNRWFPGGDTLYRWEPWHVRYVGVELATAIFQAGYLDPDSPVLPQDFYRPWKFSRGR